MRSLLRSFVAIASLGSMALMAGCGSSLESWIVSTRNHQGDLALDGRHYKEAVLAYRLALQVDPADEHAKSGFVEAEGDLAETLFAQSHDVDVYGSALIELAAAAKVDPQNVRIAGLRTDVANAELREKLVESNYPPYEAAAHSLATSYQNLRNTNNEILYRLNRFGHTFDTTDLTTAIRGSMDLESEAGKLTTRLVNFRTAVSVGAIAPDSSTSTQPTSGTSVLPLP